VLRLAAAISEAVHDIELPGVPHPFSQRFYSYFYVMLLVGILGSEWIFGQGVRPHRQLLHSGYLNLAISKQEQSTTLCPIMLPLQT
jgi:hypothetical protein